MDPLSNVKIVPIYALYGEIIGIVVRVHLVFVSIAKENLMNKQLVLQVILLLGVQTQD